MFAGFSAFMLSKMGVYHENNFFSSEIYTNDIQHQTMKFPSVPGFRTALRQ